MRVFLGRLGSSLGRGSRVTREGGTVRGSTSSTTSCTRYCNGQWGDISRGYGGRPLSRRNGLNIYLLPFGEPFRSVSELVLAIVPTGVRSPQRNRQTKGVDQLLPGIVERTHREK